MIILTGSGISAPDYDHPAILSLGRTIHLFMAEIAEIAANFVGGITHFRYLLISACILLPWHGY
ncbi:hypothetical protein ACTG15_00070 [Aeromonas sp. 164P]